MPCPPAPQPAARTRPSSEVNTVQRFILAVLGLSLALVPAAGGAAPVAAPPAAPAPPPEVVQPAAAQTIDLIPRSAWGAKPPTGPLPTHTLRRLTVHHSAQRAPDVAGAPGRIRGFQAYHQSKGFPDIAYHFVIDRAGNVYEGRDPLAPGSTFTNYDPAGHFLALLDGNYEEQQPTEAQRAALVRLLAWASQTYGIDPATLSGHRDHAATACPGRHAQALIEGGALGAALTAALAAGPVQLRRLDDAAGAARVRAIRAGG
jgi:hypothetical protein